VRAWTDFRLLGIVMKRRNGIWPNEEGSFTVEATVVAPVLLLLALSVIAFSLYAYRTVHLHQLAYETTERAAFEWNESTSGTGLYGRLSESAISWFGAALGGNDPYVELPANGQTVGLQGVRGKLSKAAQKLPLAIGGKLALADRVWMRELRLQVSRTFPLKALSGIVRLPAIERAESKSTVTDPVELARLTDLTRSYTGVIRGRISSSRAKSILQEPQAADGGAIPIRSEKEAATYLRRTTGGTLQTYPMPEGKSRIVDALDANGVGHQAFYTYTEPQLLGEQMPKDAALLKEGKVKGVVWHFFRKSGGKEPSAGLLVQLERRGIAVVVHE
jgi:hypothetical protein